MNNRHSHGIFLLVLYLTFAIFTLALTVTAASVYENISSGMEENHSVRTALSYISTKMRQADGVKIENGQIIIAEDDCVSRIYYHDGSLTEYFGEANAEFETEYGDEIISADSFEAKEENGNIHIEIGMNGRVYPLDFAQKVN